MKNLYLLLILLALCAVLFFYRLGERSLSSSHEARAAQNAQSMLDNNYWLMPQLFDRQVELQKPPLYYWLVAWLSHLLGERVNGWLVRLPAALAAAGVVFFVFVAGVLTRRTAAGFFAAAMLASCLHFTWLARVARIDMPLTLTVTLALMGFYFGALPAHRHRQRCDCKWLALGYAAIGFGLLLKGPIAFVLPFIVIVALALFGGRRFDLLRLGWWWGVPLMLAIALPWYALVNQATGGEFFREFFWRHNFARGFGGADELSANPWWFYLPRIVVDLAPWSLILLPACWYFLRHRTNKPDPLALFGLTWFVMVVLFLSCMRFKRADYLLPAYPGAALFLGCTLERIWLVARLGKWRAVTAWAWAAVVSACFVGWFVYATIVLPRTDADNQALQLAGAIRRHTHEPVIFFRAESHAVAYYSDLPLRTVLEWENLDKLASQPQSSYVVMRLSDFRNWPTHLKKGRLMRVYQTQTTTPRPLVLLRTERRY